MLAFWRRTFIVYVAFSFCVCLLFSVAVAAMCTECPQQQPATTLSAINPHWRNVAYHGMIRQINPKHVQNVKFLFLGDPVPATLRRGKRKPDMHGYGGLVAVRKKSILWTVRSSVRFYLLDANGTLLALQDIDNMEEDDVSPKFFDVDIDVTMTYYPPTPIVTYDKDGVPSFDYTSPGAQGGWMTHETKTVTPSLDAYQEERLRAFYKTKVDHLPVCQ